MIIAAAGAGYGAYQQNEAAKKQEAYQNMMAQQGKELAKRSFGLQAQQETTRLQQGQDAASQQIIQNQKAAAKARATARVAAGEAGVSGLSIDTLLDDYSRQEATFAGSVRQNRQYAEQQYGIFMKGHEAQMNRDILSTMFQPVQAPGYAGAALRIGGAGLGAYADYQRSTDRAYNNTNLG